MHCNPAALLLSPSPFDWHHDCSVDDELRQILNPSSGDKDALALSLGSIILFFPRVISSHLIQITTKEIKIRLFFSPPPLVNYRLEGKKKKVWAEMWVECVGINLNSWLSHLRRHSNTQRGCVQCLLGEEFWRGSIWYFVGQICPIRLRIGKRLHPICEKRKESLRNNTPLSVYY